jgi:hypothetical protein
VRGVNALIRMFILIMMMLSNPILISFGQATEYSIAWTSNQANLRASYNTSSEVLITLNSNETVHKIRTVPGEVVNGNITWVEVYHPPSQITGFIWSGLIIDLSEFDLGQGTKLFADSSCTGDLESVNLRQTSFSSFNGEIENTDEILEKIKNLEGAKLPWLGYPKGGEEPNWGIEHGTVPMPVGENAIFVLYPEFGEKYFLIFYQGRDIFSVWLTESKVNNGVHPPNGCTPIIITNDAFLEIIDLVNSIPHEE